VIIASEFVRNSIGYRTVSVSNELDFYATIAGLVVKCWMFVMRLSHSGKAFHVAFATQAQEAFLEGLGAFLGLLGAKVT
jgi:hypothetical protein